MLGTTHKLSRRGSWVAALMATVAAASFAVPAAAGGSLPQRETGSRLITDTLAPGGASKGAGIGYRFITDTLAPGDSTNVANVGYRLMTDTLAPGGGASTVVVSTGFDWGDAGIGAVATLGFVLLMAAGGQVALRRRSHFAS
jgi:hypothetical protein